MEYYINATELKSYVEQVLRRRAEFPAYTGTSWLAVPYLKDVGMAHHLDFSNILMASLWFPLHQLR